MEWISVKDRLPGIEQTVIVMEDYKNGFSPYTMAEDVSGAIYWEDGAFYLDHPTIDHPCKLDRVTHWMPLPEPPNE